MCSTSRVFSTSGGYYEYIGDIMSTSGGYHEYIGDIMSTSGDVQYIGRNIMMHVGEQGDKSLSIYVENPDVLMISSHMHHDIPPMYS